MNIGCPVRRTSRLSTASSSGTNGKRHVVRLAAGARDEHQPLTRVVQLRDATGQSVQRGDELGDDDAADVAPRRRAREARADELEALGALPRLLRLEARGAFSFEQRFVFLVRASALVDVQGDAGGAEHLTLLVEHHLAHAFEPMHRTVRPHDAVVEAKRTAIRDRVGDLLCDPLTVVGMQPRFPRVERARELGAFHSEELGRVRVPLDAARRDVPRPAAHPGGPHSEGEALVELRLRAFRHGSASFAATHSGERQYGPAPQAGRSSSIEKYPERPVMSNSRITGSLGCESRRWPPTSLNSRCAPTSARSPEESRKLVSVRSITTSRAP